MKDNAHMTLSCLFILSGADVYLRALLILKCAANFNRVEMFYVYATKKQKLCE